MATWDVAADLALGGGADFLAAQQTPPGLLDRLAAAPGVRVKRAETSLVQYFGFDQARSELRTSSVKDRNPFKDRRVREAVQRAIDFEGIKAALGGLGQPGRDDPQPHGGRLERGAGPSTALSTPRRRAACWRKPATPTGSTSRSTAPPRGRPPAGYPGMLARIGIKVELRLVPAGEVDRLIHAHASDFFHWGWADPLNSSLVLRSLYHSGADYAAPGVVSPELDALIDAAGRSQPPSAATADRPHLEAGARRGPLRAMARIPAQSSHRGRFTLA